MIGCFDFWNEWVEEGGGFRNMGWGREEGKQIKIDFKLSEVYEYMCQSFGQVGR